MTSAPAWLGINQNLLLHFFLIFSRFEYALKRARFIPKNTTAAKPDWDRFATTIEPHWDNIQGEQFRSACVYFIAHPPERQVIVDGQLAWKRTTRKDQEGDAAFVLRCVRTARNNLFHGGKFPTGPVLPPERDEELLQSAIHVLHGALTANRTVMEHFEAER